MCGRYAFYSPQEAVRRLFGVTSAAPLEPRYNICPTQFVPVVRTSDARTRELAMLYWGLVPFWAKEKSLGARMINARAETVAEKPAFRAAYRKRRCLVLADGYYEWRPSTQGKQPWFIRAADGEPFAMAGLWESWGTGDVLESCTIITTAAIGSVAQLHDRMPRILPASHYGEWLDPAAKLESLDAMLVAPLAAELEFYPVSKRVNSPRNEGPELIEPTRE